MNVKHSSHTPSSPNLKHIEKKTQFNLMICFEACVKCHGHENYQDNDRKIGLNLNPKHKTKGPRQ